MVRPNAEQITDCIMLQKTFMWSPSDPENVISDDAIDDDDHDDRLDTNDEANETIDKSEDDDEHELTDPLTHTESSEIHDQLEMDEEEAFEYDELSESIETWKDSFNTEDSKPPLLVNVTSDSVNVLKGRRTGVSARLRSLCNRLSLYGHSVSHRC